MNLVRTAASSTAPTYRALNPMAPGAAADRRRGRRASDHAVAGDPRVPRGAVSRRRRCCPRDPWLRARARQLAEMVNSGIQPLQNLAVLGRAWQRSAWATRRVGTRTSSRAACGAGGDRAARRPGRSWSATPRRSPTSASSRSSTAARRCRSISAPFPTLLRVEAAVRRAAGVRRRAPRRAVGRAGGRSGAPPRALSPRSPPPHRCGSGERIRLGSRQARVWGAGGVSR